MIVTCICGTALASNLLYPTLLSILDEQSSCQTLFLLSQALHRYSNAHASAQHTVQKLELLPTCSFPSSKANSLYQGRGRMHCTQLQAIKTRSSEQHADQPCSPLRCKPPPVMCVLQALQYKQRIQDAIPDNSSFQPLMTCYLTDNTSPEEVHEAKSNGVVAYKLYPAGATTNSSSGVTNFQKVIPTLKAMADVSPS